MLAENGMSPDDFRTAFKQFDTDGNGLIDVTEFRVFVREVCSAHGVPGLRLRTLWPIPLAKFPMHVVCAHAQVLGLRLRKPELSSLWKMVDTDNSGEVNFAEFTAIVFPNLDLDELQLGTASFKAPADARPREDDDDGKEGGIGAGATAARRGHAGSADEGGVLSRSRSPQGDFRAGSRGNGASLHSASLHSASPSGTSARCLHRCSNRIGLASARRIY